MMVEFVLRLSVALGCGLLIGVERQYRQRTAGLRTSAFVATGSALFVLAAALTPNESSPTRIAAQVVSGVGFLCAGVIIRDGLTIRGLNTAGTLWCASGVGVLAGSGYVLPAFLGCILVLVANLLLAYQRINVLVSSNASFAFLLSRCKLGRVQAWGLVSISLTKLLNATPGELRWRVRSARAALSRWCFHSRWRR